MHVVHQEVQLVGTSRLLAHYFNSISLVTAHDMQRFDNLVRLLNMNQV